MTKDCTKTSIGLTPLFPGVIPPSLSEDHLSRGIELGSQVQKVDGKLVVAFVGMSNWRQEILAFTKLTRAERIRGIVWYNAGRGNWDLRGMVENAEEYWAWFKTGIAKRNITTNQIQVLFVKNSVRKGTTIPGYQSLMTEHINQAAKELPFLKQIFISSAIYSGYAQAGAPRNEPQAYFEGIAVNEFMIDNENNEPWVSWGPYLWADGLEPRGDGLIWPCEDFELDGVHPATGAENKVADMLYRFLKNSPTTGWFAK